MKPDLFTKDEAKEVTSYLLGDGGNGGLGREGNLTEEADYKLYCILQPEMPYGVQKARTATPDEWYPTYFAHYSEDEIRQWVVDHTVKEGQ